MQRCGACTFDNPPGAFLCEMCNAELGLCQECISKEQVAAAVELAARRLKVACLVSGRLGKRYEAQSGALADTFQSIVLPFLVERSS